MATFEQRQAWWRRLVLSEQVVQILSKHELYPLWPNFLEELVTEAPNEH